MLRIGAEGDAELPLQQVNVMPADDLPRLLNPMEPKDSVRVFVFFFQGEQRASTRWSKLRNPRAEPDAFVPAARKVWHTQGLADRMVAEFVAGASGEVFLYVNDAVLQFLHRSVSTPTTVGKGEVTLQRLPLPPLQQMKQQMKRKGSQRSHPPPPPLPRGPAAPESAGVNSLLPQSLFRFD